MKRIFTKNFFRLSHSDQAAVVDSVIRELQGCIGRHLNPADDRRAKERIKRIEKRAVEYGVYEM